MGDCGFCICFLAKHLQYLLELKSNYDAFPGATGNNQWLTTQQKLLDRNSLQQKVGQTVGLQPMKGLDHASCSRVKHRPQESINRCFRGGNRRQKTVK